MTVARSTGAFLGTSETVGVSIANGNGTTGSEVDLFGNSTSEGWFNLYLAFTSTVTSGTINVTLFYARVTGQEATAQANIVASFAPINGSQIIYCGAFQASRFMEGRVDNVGTGASATNVSLLYELFQES